MRRRRSVRRRNQALGVVFILLLGALGWLTVAIYNKDFASTVPVTLRADRAGSQLRLNADVKVRGMVVGSVRGIETAATAWPSNWSWTRRRRSCCPPT
ncbi:hypothetical protein ACFQV2_15485 [Actinokineospora soli]|uniref:MlaD protein n=1 Tax=Actinokineospora soli TaxID=1048753 RepID=A0ABW2TQA2_9PSEU